MIQNVLIELGVAINVMIAEVVNKLKLYDMHPIITILQMADQSIAKLEGIIKDVQVTMDS